MKIAHLACPCSLTYKSIDSFARTRNLNNFDLNLEQEGVLNYEDRKWS